MNEITLQWPDRLLSPNARPHWAQKARASKKAREVGFYAAKEAKAVVDWEGDIHAFITFYPPDARGRDDDNLVANFKSYRDGIADALKVDDKRMRIHPHLSGQVIKGGRVTVTLCADPAEFWKA